MLISFEEFSKNREQCIEMVNKFPNLISKRETKGGFTGDYLTWLHVWKWVRRNYNWIGFEVVEVRVSEAYAGYVIGRIFDIESGKNLGQLGLNLESFKRVDFKTKETTYVNETVEQLQMRVFVKLIANYTGFGIHLWEKR